MYDFFRGIVTNNNYPYLVLDVSGVGYRLEVTKDTLFRTKIGEEIIVYAEFISNDSGVFLYGFLSEEERNLFQLLRSVNTIGGKTALGIIGAVNPNDLIFAIQNEDKELLKKCPGIGEKSAIRIILELKDKLKNVVVENVEKPIENKAKMEVFEALESLGYTRYELQKKLKGIDFTNIDTNEALKQALKLMNS